MILNLDIEWICLAEFFRLVRRSNQYIPLVIAMYGRSFLFPRRSQMLRATYTFARAIDDLIDGDRDCREEPREYVSHILAESKSPSCPQTYLGRLGQFVFRNLNAYSAGEEEPVADLDRLIAAMLFDGERFEKTLVLPSSELERHHRETFESALNVALCISGAHTRAYQINSVVEAQLILYTLRDLNADLARGIINIPREVVGLERLTRDQVPSLLSSDAVHDWIYSELEIGAGLASKADQQVSRLADRRGRIVLRPLCRGFRTIVKKLTRQADFPGTL